MANNVLLLMLMAEQRRRWEQGDFVSVEDYLESHPAVKDDPEAVLDLIGNEIGLRRELVGTEEAGYLRHDYLRRFPQYAEALHAQGQLDDVLRHLGDGDAAPVDVPEPAGSIEVPGYKLLGELGRGGMGVVYKAHHLALDRLVALKICRDDSAAWPERIAQFRLEAQTLARLQHPAIIPVYDLGSARGGRLFFTMQLIEGEALQAVLARRRNVAAGLLSFLRIFQAIAEAVAMAHRHGVLHRDLKPGNVMLSEGEQVHLVDWGLGRLINDGAEGLLVDGGSAAYLSPEQATAAPALDPRSDVFGLGGILCAILTGTPPFLGSAARCREQAAQGDLAGAFRRLDGCGADPELVRLARRCLSPRPAQRPADAAAVAEALRGFLSSLQEKLHRERRLRRLAVALAALVVVLVVLASSAWVRRAETETAVRLALDNAALLREAAANMPVTTAAEARLALGKWRQCEAAVKEAETALALGAARPDVRERVIQWRRTVDAALRALGDAASMDHEPR